MSYTLIFLTPLSIFSTNSWLMMWAIMEINTFAFILMLIQKENLNNHESAMKYFIIQTIASLMFLIVWLLLNFLKKHQMISNSPSNLLTLLLLMKMAAPPLHSWITKMSISMKDNPLMIILSWQKFIPLFILCQLSINMILLTSVIIGGVMSTLTQFNLNSSTLIIVFSSMSHLSWMFLSTHISLKMVMSYLIMYSIILFPIIKIFKKSKTSSFSFLSNMYSPSPILIMILAMAGIPPLLGFLPKWMIIKNLTSAPALQNILILLLILTSINFFIYSRLISNSWFLPSNQLKNMKINNFPKILFSANFTLPLIMLLL